MASDLSAVSAAAFVAGAVVLRGYRPPRAPHPSAAGEGLCQSLVVEYQVSQCNAASTVASGPPEPAEAVSGLSGKTPSDAVFLPLGLLAQPGARLARWVLGLGGRRRAQGQQGDHAARPHRPPQGFASLLRSLIPQMLPHFCCWGSG